ncbi:hypothetical protein D9M71_433840 [compost metagenome]
MQISFAHIHVDQQYTLTGLSDDCCEVGGNERFTYLGARAGDHQAIIAGFEHGEVQTGAQAAQTFYGQVGGVTAGQYGGDLVGAASAAPQDFAFFRFLQRAERNGCVHRQSQLFNLIRIFHATIKSFAKKH